jgi:chemotaxis protein CheD
MDIEVHMGDIAVAEGPDNLVTSGIGSCLIVTLYDAKRQIGALAHAMLPSSPMQNTKCDAHSASDSSCENPPDWQECLASNSL